eukprot:gnl/Trimastix_PCT/3872.p1 GENE.gnl/Trimastix_PCT/3872~~gnl/Trimastix_PCT/3872.p1  ORF type:complete len:818 (+),score=258.27 gnl/Trimastix_PCT/3872:92-2455(+)
MHMHTPSRVTSFEAVVRPNRDPDWVLLPGVRKNKGQRQNLQQNHAEFLKSQAAELSKFQRSLEAMQTELNMQSHRVDDLKRHIDSRESKLGDKESALEDRRAAMATWEQRLMRMEEHYQAREKAHAAAEERRRQEQAAREREAREMKERTRTPEEDKNWADEVLKEEEALPDELRATLRSLEDNQRRYEEALKVSRVQALYRGRSVRRRYPKLLERFRHQSKVLLELAETEESYASVLHRLVTDYIRPLETAALHRTYAWLTPDAIQSVFANARELEMLHREMAQTVRNLVTESTPVPQGTGTKTPEEPSRVMNVLQRMDSMAEWVIPEEGEEEEEEEKKAKESSGQAGGEEEEEEADEGAREEAERERRRRGPWIVASRAGAVAELFLRLAPGLSCYTKYVNNYNKAIATQLSLSSKSQLASLLDVSWSSLPNLLIQPIQRLPRYEMLFKDLIKHSEEFRDSHNLLVLAHQAMKEVNRLVNESKRAMDRLDQFRDRLSTQLPSYPSPATSPAVRPSRVGSAVLGTPPPFRPQVPPPYHTSAPPSPSPLLATTTSYTPVRRSSLSVPPPPSTPPPPAHPPPSNAPPANRRARSWGGQEILGTRIPSSPVGHLAPTLSPAAQASADSKEGKWTQEGVFGEIVSAFQRAHGERQILEEATACQTLVRPTPRPRQVYLCNDSLVLVKRGRGTQLLLKEFVPLAGAVVSELPNLSEDAALCNALLVQPGVPDEHSTSAPLSCPSPALSPALSGNHAPPATPAPIMLSFPSAEERDAFRQKLEAHTQDLRHL